LEKARDTGEPTATPPITSIILADQAPSCALFWPVYRSNSPPASVTERRATLIGFAHGSIHLDWMLRATLAKLSHSGEAITLFADPEAGVPQSVPTLVYRPETGLVSSGNARLGAVPDGGIRAVRRFQAFGREWGLVFDYPSAQVRAQLSNAPWIYLCLGLLMTLLTGGHALRELRRRLAAESTILAQATAREHIDGQLKAIVEAAPHAVIGLDPEQRVLFWNRAAERMFDHREAEIIGLPCPIVPLDERLTFDRRFAQVAAGEILRGRESLTCRKDGTAVETRSSLAPFYDSQHRLQGIVIEIEDLTERNRIERQLMQPQRMEAVGLLTGGVSHDFNNLLGAVIGNLEMALEEMEANSPPHELVDAALEAAQRGAALIRQLLSFARRQPLTPETVVPNQALLGTVRLLQRTLGEGVTITLDAREPIWPVLIDVVQFETAILNLAVNARDAMDGGGSLTIETANATLEEATLVGGPEVKPGDYVMIAVSDTGCGMTQDVLARVWDPFFTTKGSNGTGLGLSMVHGFLRQSGGHGKIESAPGKGTTVRLYLPRTQSEADAEQAVSKPPEIVTGREAILVVEDNAALRKTALRQLESLGYRTIEANDAVEALKILRSGVPVDLLFTDVVMPGGIDGRSLADMARNLRPALGVLFTSGFTGTTSLSGEDFPDALLNKPYRRRELALSVRKALEARTTGHC
jgi:PAS domain S-box-containing protein